MGTTYGMGNHHSLEIFIDFQKMCHHLCSHRVGTKKSVVDRSIVVVVVSYIYIYITIYIYFRFVLFLFWVYVL